MIKIKEFFNSHQRLVFNICSGLILISSLLLTIFHYEFIVKYFLLVFKKLLESASFWIRSFGEMLHIIDEKPIPPGEVIASGIVNNIDVSFIDYLNIDIELLTYKFTHLWEGMKQGSNFLLYNVYFMFYSLFVALYGLTAYIIWEIIKIILEIMLMSPAEHPGEATTSLKIFKKYVVQPVLKAIKAIYIFFLEFFDKWYYKLPFILIWLFNFNLINAAGEFISFYFVWPFSPSIFGILNVIVTMIIDFIIMLGTAPWPVWVILFWWFFSSWRKKYAYKKLNHQECRNMGFIKESSKDWIIIAPIRTGKDLIMTYCSLLVDKIFHRDSYESLFKFKRMFPDFPFWQFERDLDEKISSRKIKGPFSAEDYVLELRAIYVEMDKNPDYLYGYEGRMQFNDSYKYVDIFEVLVEFAKCYFVYALGKTYIQSTMPIRTDIKLESIGNFPKWDDDLLGRTPDDFDEYSRYCRNLDYDSLRYGTHEDEDNGNIGSFEFGINVYGEFDKERGNQVTNSHMRYDDPECNPLNDGMEIGMKTLGHASTYDFKTYYMSFANTQRPSSLMANDLELRDKMVIGKVDKGKLALPLYIENLLINPLIDFFQEFDLDLSFFGKEAFTLPTYILNHIFSAIFTYDYRIKNSYCYDSYTLFYERAGRHDKGENVYIMDVPWKIAHNNRYPTDYLNPFFKELNKSSSRGILDQDEFEGKRPTDSEFEKQHSRLYKDFSKNYRRKK